MKQADRYINSYKFCILVFIAMLSALTTLISVGFGALNQNLNISGDIDYEEHSKLLYDVLKKQANIGTYAKEYTGNHQDTFNNSGNNKIYHWYGADDTAGTAITNKDNVKLGRFCFKMLRTTDTGGVKLIYNGEYDSTNKCNTSRSNHVGLIGTNGSTRNLNGSYVYGDSFTYNEETGVFTLTNTTTATWSNSTYRNLLGKFTCSSASNTCTTLYNVNSYSSNTVAHTTSYTVGNTHYSQIGTSSFNANRYSPAMVGYMFNNVYNASAKNMSFTESVYSYLSPSTNFWYADSVTWDSSTRKYSLVNPYQVSSSSDYPNLVGKYTFGNTSSTYTASAVYNIVATGSYRFDCLYLQSGQNISDVNYTYAYGDSYIDNGNGSYTINNPTIISRIDYYNNYENFKWKYYCRNVVNNICSDLRYATDSNLTNDQIIYIPVANNYKYASGYSYNSNTNTYTLNNDSVTFFNSDDNNNTKSISTHHYTCWNETGVCNTLSYVHNTQAKFFYMELTDGKSIDDIINEMLYDNDVNMYNSSIKGIIDAWFRQNMNGYTSYLEDVIYCNDRKMNHESWNSLNASLVTFLEFDDGNIDDATLKCDNVTDQFSLTNTKATLTYPVGLASYIEMNLLNNKKIRSTGQSFFLASPDSFCQDVAYGSYISSGSLYMASLYRTEGVRPVVSLKTGTEFTDGNGSMDNPYVIDLE